MGKNTGLHFKMSDFITISLPSFWSIGLRGWGFPSLQIGDWPHVLCHCGREGDPHKLRQELEEISV